MNPRSSRALRLPWRSGAGRAVIGATLLVLAAASVLGAIDSVHWDTAGGIGIVGLGAVLIAAAFAGGARWLIIPGLLLAGVVGFLKAADVHLRGGWGDRDVAVASVADLHDRYDLSAGAAAHRPARPAAQPRARSEASAPASGWATS